MEKIPSFKIDHNELLVGAYVSRIDRIGTESITTFDLRFTRPNIESVMSTGCCHAMEHLAATFLRNCKDIRERVVYFGPMGCRTGFYYLQAGIVTPEEILPYLRDMCRFVIDFTGPIPGANPRDCGNYSDMNLGAAKRYAEKYLNEFLIEPKPEQMVYPD